ncbi:unnamed protein product [Pleuronectes platessa]|uniref:Uncharacterized protein n=1 Tax=Pleuronectes platessa TaxID=8262 RepID=A0A9N7TX94_PLEPL|nr:unnamed protein product [Pleuronectes platessa]
MSRGEARRGRSTLEKAVLSVCVRQNGEAYIGLHGYTGGGAILLLGRGAVSVAGAECGDRLEGTGWRGPGTAVGGGDSRHMSVPSRGSLQLRRPLGEPSVRARGPLRRCTSAGS